MHILINTKKVTFRNEQHLTRHHSITKATIKLLFDTPLKTNDNNKNESFLTENP